MIGNFGQTDQETGSLLFVILNLDSSFFLVSYVTRILDILCGEEKKKEYK